MFGGPYNRLPYNRAFTVEAFFTVSFDSKTEFTSRLSIEMPLTATIESNGEMVTAMERGVHFGPSFESITEMITKQVREMVFGITAESKTEFLPGISYYYVNEIIFTGDFKPGDKIVIDSQRFKITKNGLNVFHEMDGDFFELNTGENTLTYIDSETGREILLRVTHRDKFLY